MLISIIPTVAVYILYYRLVVAKLGVASIDNIFIITNFIMMYGTLLILDPHSYIDRDYSSILSYTLVIFMVSSFLTFTILYGFRGKINQTKIIDTRLPKFIYYLWMISVIITFLYYFTIGYNVFTLGISSILSGTQEDIATLRLDSYSGSRYLFPGYVNQFKNIFLPATTVLIIGQMLLNRTRNRKIFIPIMITILLIGILGTGQRGAFISFALTTIVYLIYRNRQNLIKISARALVLALPILLISTLILNRKGTQSNIEDNPLSALFALLGEFSDRVFYDNQFSAVAGFRYVSSLTVRNGSEWLLGLTGLLPGSGGSDLSNQIFATIYGTTRGTAPVGLWGSTYYNFGIAGTVILPITLGISYQLIYFLLMKKGYINSIQCFAAAGIFVTFGLWVAEGPSILFNTGLVAYIFLYIVGARLNDRYS
ncbi:O-antigen polymerase [Deinococcus alpinitundrae]|uniref:O-antigen polymerase n=1 Tax=Deinococcus alpinitundrae TaxID=468913 RepID=UPI001ED92980|nr:O-antigen polymerase [Deinococcus alpinitundrae]